MVAALNPNRIRIFDTTLRDGEQSPGASMHRSGKLKVARALMRLKVDVIEAGFPVASPGDEDSVKAIAEQIEGPIICGLARCIEKDIAAAGRALAGRKNRRIHVFCATSQVHRERKLKKSPEEILRTTERFVKMALGLADDIEFSPEDASRTELPFLEEVVTAAIEAGARTINLPDTVGFAVPEQYGAMFKRIAALPIVTRTGTILSAHTHNDLGLATVNALAAVQNGARQVECTVNGIGERAGNAALEEVVMALHTRRDAMPFTTGIVTKGLCSASRILTSVTGMQVQRNKAIVGRNAFKHESGIHVDGMEKDRTTYEIIDPKIVGARFAEYPLGKHSGKAAVRAKAIELGYEFSEAQLDELTGRVKKLADERTHLYDADIEVLFAEAAGANGSPWKLGPFSARTGDSESGIPQATVTLIRTSDDLPFTESAFGTGEIDAIAKCINRILGIRVKLLDYSAHSAYPEADAVGIVSVMLGKKGRLESCQNANPDTLKAFAHAYLGAAKKFLKPVKTA